MKCYSTILANPKCWCKIFDLFEQKEEEEKEVESEESESEEEESDDENETVLLRLHQWLMSEVMLHLKGGPNIIS